MRIAVFGASGKVGQAVTAEALGRGHSVNAFIHRTNPFDEKDDLHLFRGNIHDPAAVALILTESDAVISVLGSWGTKTKDILQTGMQRIIPAMHAEGISRIATLTGNLALRPSDIVGAKDGLAHRLASIPFSKILEDAEAHMRLLEESGLEWTTIRASRITANGNNTYELVLSPISWAFVPRAAVANCLVDLVERHDFIGQAPFIRSAPLGAV
jgi:putative NADH-flavin reductase